MTELAVHDLGRASYADAEALQRRLLERVRAGERTGHVVLVEHDPAVITLGRRGRREHILVSDEELRRAGIEVVASARGGDVTWHGPGQLVAYPIISLRPRLRSVAGHVRALEQAAIGVLAEFGITGARRRGRPGVWVGESAPGEKVAAVGVAVSRWVSWHGLALNVASDLTGFGLIVPCGLGGTRVTSLSRLLGREMAVEEVKPPLVTHLRQALDLRSPKG